jgi:acyl-CoA thioester hydrolase
VIRLHKIGVRVYYEDTDAGGIVYYANYLRFFERARTDWLRAAGISQQELAQLEGLNLVVRDCAVQYLRPARLDDLLEVDVGVADPATDVGRASLRLTQRALLVQGPMTGQEQAAGPVLATGTVRVACINRHTGRPAPLPARILQLLAGQLAAAAPARASVQADTGQDSMPLSTSLPQQVFTRVTSDGTAEQQ